MTQALSVSISHSAAETHWGEGALLSFAGSQATIHLSDNKDAVRNVQKAARKLDTMGIPTVALSGELWDIELRWAFAQGFYSAKTGCTLDWGDVSEAEQEELSARKLASEFVRDITNRTPEDLGPSQLALDAAKYITDLAPDAVTYRIVTGEELKSLGYMGIYNVGKGSPDRPGALLKLDYNPSGDPDAPVAAALVGKGITFDSGGYSIKPSDGMAIMKSDMGGAAMVTGGLGLAISRGLNKRVKLFLCCAENLISGSAYKLGDIITYKNGLTVEVLNSDAEGRLVLADGLMAASETKAPLILDAATLTGAAKIALGRDYNAVIGLDQDLVHQVLTNASQENELAWPLPLASWHTSQLSSAFADMANIHSGEGMAGATTAAAFLSRFVDNPEKGWVHMDLAGSYQKGGNELWATGAKGHGVRTIAQTLLSQA